MRATKYVQNILLGALASLAVNSFAFSATSVFSVTSYKEILPKGGEVRAPGLKVFEIEVLNAFNPNSKFAVIEKLTKSEDSESGEVRLTGSIAKVRFENFRFDRIVHAVESKQQGAYISEFCASIGNLYVCLNKVVGTSTQLVTIDGR